MIFCPACQDEKNICLGVPPIFTSDFLDRPLRQDDFDRRLYECRVCNLQFKFPLPDSQELETYYQAQSSEARWDYGESREVWQFIREDLDIIPERSILDIGCFRGELLHMMGPTWQRFGIEPSTDAARIAENRGAIILTKTLEQLEPENHRFGAITLIDVIEHLRQPLVSLQKLSQMLLPGGKLIIFTGNTDALSWRFAGVDYWYCALPEHITFFNQLWFRWAAPLIKCDILSMRRLPHHPAGFSARVDESVKNIAWVLYNRLNRISAVSSVLGRTPGINRIGTWKSCWWTSARDHILITMIRK